MGTNFYLTKADEQRRHIGKRSAAGLWCWDCGTSLAASAYRPTWGEVQGHTVYGADAVHHSQNRQDHATCPLCGAAPAGDEGISKGAVSRELGFDKSLPARKTGVRSCASFLWAIEPGAARALSLEGWDVVDEYDRPYSWGEFLGVLKECPIRDFHSVGEAFS